MEMPAGFDPEYHKNKPICGVLAVAICANVSYDVAHARCKDNQPSHCKRFRGTTYFTQRKAALSQLWVRFTELDYKHLSVMEFCMFKEGDNFTYMLDIRGHCITFKDGLLIDQHGIVPWRKYKHPRIKIRRCLRIEK